jgi:hypothetical protein
MTSTTWHVADDVLERYARAPRELASSTASSADAHLLTCARCRARVAESVPSGSIDSSWASVADRIDRPRQGVVERCLTVLGVRPAAARLAAATPALQFAWLASVVVVTGAVVAVARERDSTALFLALAPVVPLGSVAITFMPGNEPGGEAAFAAPISGAGVMLRRATAVIVASMLCLVMGSFALPDLAVRDAGWLLPSLALTMTALAAGTWRPVEQAAGALAVGWFGTVLVVGAIGDSASIESSALFAASGQVAALAAAAIASLVFVRRRKHLLVLGGWSWQ